MHSFTIHESRNLKQARPKGQYVDLLRYTLATPSWDFMDDIVSLSMSFVKLFKPDASLHEIQDLSNSKNLNLNYIVSTRFSISEFTYSGSSVLELCPAPSIHSIRNPVFLCHARLYLIQEPA